MEDMILELSRQIYGMKKELAAVDFHISKMPNYATLDELLLEKHCLQLSLRMCFEYANNLFQRKCSDSSGAWQLAEGGVAR